MESTIQEELREAIHGLDMRSMQNAARLQQIEKSVETIPHIAESLARVETTLAMLVKGREGT